MGALKQHFGAGSGTLRRQLDAAPESLELYDIVGLDADAGAEAQFLGSVSGRESDARQCYQRRVACSWTIAQQSSNEGCGALGQTSCGRTTVSNASRAASVCSAEKAGEVANPETGRVEVSSSAAVVKVVTSRASTSTGVSSIAATVGASLSRHQMS
jgi:hypothetical protein